MYHSLPDASFTAAGRSPYDWPPGSLVEIAPAASAFRYVAPTSDTYIQNVDGIGWYGPSASLISIAASPIFSVVCRMAPSVDVARPSSTAPNASVRNRISGAPFVGCRYGCTVGASSEK